MWENQFRAKLIQQRRQYRIPFAGDFAQCWSIGFPTQHVLDRLGKNGQPNENMHDFERFRADDLPPQLIRSGVRVGLRILSSRSLQTISRGIAMTYV